MLERRAGPDAVRRAFTISVMPNSTTSRSTSSTGFPARAPPSSSADLAEALALGPEHISCYELEAKPGTRFTHAHGAELERQAEAMEDYFERVVERLTAAGYRWYETANFCRAGAVDGRDLRARHNLGYWLGRDYLGLGIGAVSTVGTRGARNTPSARRYLDGARSRRATRARARAARRRDPRARAGDARAPPGRAAAARRTRSTPLDANALGAPGAARPGERSVRKRTVLRPWSLTRARTASSAAPSRPSSSPKIPA